MRYPTATQSQCRDFARARMRGDEYDLEPHWVGSGEDVDLRGIEEAAAGIRDLMNNADQSQSRRDQVEGEAAAILYRALCPAPGTGRPEVEVSVLDDPGFWRYLSLKYFWDFVEWRTWKKPGRFRESTHLGYVDALRSTKCVLTRMYLRMASLGGSEHDGLASCLPKAADFWRSHVIRVRTGCAPGLVRAMVEGQRDARLTTDSVRELAKRVNRTWSNVLLDLYTQEDAAELLAELRAGLDEPMDDEPPAGDQ